MIDKGRSDNMIIIWHSKNRWECYVTYRGGMDKILIIDTLIQNEVRHHHYYWHENVLSGIVNILWLL